MVCQACEGGWELQTEKVKLMFLDLTLISVTIMHGDLHDVNVPSFDISSLLFP